MKCTLVHNSFLVRSTLSLSLILLLNLAGFSQDYGWWNEKHNWDGVTPWTDYIIISPGFMGPNALPVPEIKKGLLPQNSSFELSVENHFGYGDYTQNLFAELYATLFSDNVALYLTSVPVEHYRTDTLIRDERRSREYDPQGISAGDIYLGTAIQIVKNKPVFPDVLISFTLKTALAGNLGGARFTDSPGYYFDLSGSKEFQLSNSALTSIRPYGLVGFYAWQTYSSNLRQNDAVIYGLGFDLTFRKFMISQTFGGYSGYKDNGDKPMVYRAEFKTTFESALNFKFMLQHGFRDFPYHTIRAGVVYNMDPVFGSLAKSFIE